MISVKELVRKYGDIVAVDNVSTTIEKGEIVGLLGHNGAGKTTLMKMITGFLEPTSGVVTVGGVDVAVDRIGVQRQIGYLPENAPLYPEMLVQEYLLMMAELRGLSGEDAERAVADAARQTGVVEYMVRPISMLSKGYRQRVGIAQAILHRPAVLVLDEPTNGLDPMQIQAIRGLIRRLGESTTIILSTHILQEIEAVCDRVLIMIGGRLVTDSALNDLLGSDRLLLSVATTGDVPAAFRRIPGVTDVQTLGEDPMNPGSQRFAVASADDRPRTTEILKAGMEAGWTIASLGREHRTLEQVMKELQDREIARQVKAPTMTSGGVAA
jgi:ABC-2 type transport system ATP-binding protein